MSKKSVPPSIKETAFDCPHCGAYTTQTWLTVYARPISRESRTPFLPDEEFISDLMKQLDAENREKYKDWFKKINSGLVFLEKHNDSEYGLYTTGNVFLSECYNCQKVALWIHDRLLFPPNKSNHPPSVDLPDDIRRDYEEAQTIVDLSPRGAAALLRLCIQKLCGHLGEKGSNINDDIASLVSKGLNSKVQKALDVVRVVGNEAVHPGSLDLRDDIGTASTLFALVNMIVEQMITQHKVVDELYAKLPEKKLLEIEKRNQKALE